MSRNSRREFIKHASTGVATAAAFSSGVSAQIADSKIRVGLIGCGGRGCDVAEKMAMVKNVAITP